MFVGTGWKSLVIFDAQGPVDLGSLSVGKSELGLGRDVLVGDEVFHGFDGLSKRWIARQLRMDLVHPL